MFIEREDIRQLLSRSHLFRGIDRERLEVLAGELVPVEYSAGTPVFLQGEDNEAFYFVYSGRLKASRQISAYKASQQLGHLETGDYFGQEVLAENWPRQISVEAEEDSILLRLDVPQFKALLEQVPVLSKRLQFILDVYRLMLHSRFTYMDPDEFIYYIGRRHPIFLIMAVLPPVVFGLVSIPIFLYLTLSSALSLTFLILLLLVSVITVGWLVWNWVDYINDYYIVSNRRVIYQERIVLLYDSRQEAPMEAVQSTTTNTSQIGRMVGYGNVATRTYIGTIMFRNVAMPEQVMALLQEQQMRAQTGAHHEEMKKIEQILAQSLTGAPFQKAPPPKPAASTQVAGFQRFLSDLFHLRYEINGTIIYRTHWFILLKKIWLPSLLIMGLLMLLLSSLFSLFTLISPLATFLLVLFFGTIVGIWFAYRYADWHNDIYLITTDQVVDVYKKPLGSEQRDAAPIKNILSIEYKRLGFIGLILNYGTVFIRVGDRELTFDDVFNPSGIQRELFDRLAAKNYAEKQAAQEKEGQRLAEWFAAYNRVNGRNQTPTNQNPRARGGF